MGHVLFSPSDNDSDIDVLDSHSRRRVTGPDIARAGLTKSDRKQRKRRQKALKAQKPVNMNFESTKI